MPALTHCKTWDLGNVISSLRKDGHEIKTIGSRHKVKYQLIDKETGEPVSSRFIKSKQAEPAPQSVKSESAV
jgi:hypothetical protein